MIVVYYMTNQGPKCEVLEDSELTEALKMSAALRKVYSHVSISSEPGDLVGGLGVSSVEDGKLPDGEKYEWSKAHRAGMRTPRQ